MSDASLELAGPPTRLPGPVHALLAGLIDYAGLFPPAGLGMADTVRNYAAYQAGGDAWALARLVVPATRLQEFEAALTALPEAERLGARFPLTVLLGTDPVADMAAVCTFTERHVHGGPVILSLEARVAGGEQVARLAGLVSEEYELYCELPLTGDLTALVGQVGAAGAGAKIRTGGVTPGDIPGPEAVLAFLAACATEGVPCKATAGLHHAVRGEQALTYAPDSPRGTLFGYLNVVLAATAVWQERSTDEAYRLLTLSRADALALDEDGLRWGGVALTREEISQARVEFIRAIGSCSFTEPLAEAPRA